MYMEFRNGIRNTTIIRGCVGKRYDVLPDGYFLYTVTVQRRSVSDDDYHTSQYIDLRNYDRYEIVTKNRDLRCGDIVIAEGELCMLTGGNYFCPECGNELLGTTREKFVLKVDKFYDANYRSDDGWLEDMIRSGWNTKIVLGKFNISGISIRRYRNVCFTDDLIFRQIVTTRSIRKLFPKKCPELELSLEDFSDKCAAKQIRHRNCFEGRIILRQDEENHYSLSCDNCGFHNSFDFKMPIVFDMN